MNHCNGVRESKNVICVKGLLSFLLAEADVQSRPSRRTVSTASTGLEADKWLQLEGGHDLAVSTALTDVHSTAVPPLKTAPRGGTYYLAAQVVPKPPKGTIITERRTTPDPDLSHKRTSKFTSIFGSWQLTRLLFILFIVRVSASSSVAFS